MGLRIEKPASEASPSSFDALLFTTMCMIGLPVEVQVKDGSVYSGIFHTASVEGEYGVVLKMARMVCRGEGNTNLSVGAVVDTLVVLPGDLVQVVVKGVLVPADGIVVNLDNDAAKTVIVSAQSPSCNSFTEREPNTLKSGKASSESFVEEDMTHICENRRLNQNEESTAHGLKSKHFGNGFLTKGENEVGLREAVAKPMESILQVDSGKTDAVDIAKVEEVSSGHPGSNISDERQDGRGKPQMEEDGFTSGNDENMLNGVSCSSSTTAACIPQQNYLGIMAVESSSKTLPNGSSSCDLASPVVISEAPALEVPTSVNQLADAPALEPTTPRLSLLSSPTESVSSKKSNCGTNSKEFKLNPAAKTFSPSFVNPRPIPPAVTAVSTVAYGPSVSPVVPVASAQPGIEISPFAPCTTVPVKFGQHSNLVAGNIGGGTQYGLLSSLPIAGHVGSREQPVRYNSQYQAGSAYVHPSQTVMVGRMGQIVHVQPITHDAIQGAATVSQVPARHILAPYQAHLPKHQGAVAQTLPVRMAPTFTPAVQQSFAFPSQIPFPQHFAAIQPISVPAINSALGGKFH